MTRRGASGRSPASPLAWCGVAALLGLGALVVQWVGGAARTTIDWQPALAGAEPWRAWSAAWVHYSALHLGANLLGCALVAALGVAAHAPRRAAIAWLAAWPLTQLGLLAQPALAHYGGLSGVLHGGVAIIAVQLLLEAPRRHRGLGVAILAGLAVKLVLEAPWRGPLAHPPGWDIATAPGAHVSGVVAGLAAAALLLPHSPFRTESSR